MLKQPNRFDQFVAMLWFGAGITSWYWMLDLAFFVELTPKQEAARGAVDLAFPWALFGTAGIYCFWRGIRFWRQSFSATGLGGMLSTGDRLTASQSTQRQQRVVPPMPTGFVDSVREKIRRFEDFGIRSTAGEVPNFAQAVWQELHHLLPEQTKTVKDADPFEILMKMTEMSGPSGHEDVLSIPLDIEQFEGDYSRLAQKLAGFSQGALPLEQIEETDLSGDGSRRALAFLLNGKPHRKEFDVQPKWLNGDVLQWLGSLMTQQTGGFRFAALWDGALTLIRLRQGQLDEFNAFFGIPFEWLGETVAPGDALHRG